MDNGTRTIPIDKKIFWPSLIVILALTLPLMFDPAGGEKIVRMVLKFFLNYFGSIFLWFGIACFVVLVWLAFGRYGNVKLGGPDDEKEFSDFSYVSMLFCAGFGIGAMVWGFIENAYYFKSPPFGIEPRSALAGEYGVAYTLFHRGWAAWAMYCLPAIPIAYSVYVKKMPFLRMSAASEGLIGEKYKGWQGKIIDILAVFGVVGGVGTSLGLGVPLVSACISEITGVPDAMPLKIVVLAAWTALFAASVYRGLKKGINLLSNINLYVGLALISFILLVGPTLFTIKSFTNSCSLYFSDFFRMHLWMNPTKVGGFSESWTAFYWAWWIAYGPMMGLFVARISKGRTIRNVILSELVWGLLGGWFLYTVLASYGAHLNINNIIDISGMLKESGQPTTIITILQTLPVSGLVLVVFTVLCFVFLATTLDSSAFILASVCSLDIKGNEEPALWHRMFWALMLSLVAVALMLVGGLKPVQLSSVIVAVPLMIVMGIMFMSLLNWLKNDFGEETQVKILAKDVSIADKATYN
jgi:BCCT family betaine/carnitine transporter